MHKKYHPVSPAADGQIVSLHNARYKRREKIFKVFNCKQLTNIKSMILNSREIATFAFFISTPNLMLGGEGIK